MKGHEKIYEILYPSSPIMVVDDEDAILFSIDTVLRMAGLNNIITCNDGRNVLNIISRQKIELMLLDLSMPYLPGEELLKMLSTAFPEIPVVIITATTNEDSAVRCMRSGAFDYVVKPLDEGRLVAAVNHALSFRKTNESNLPRASFQDHDFK